MRLRWITEADRRADKTDASTYAAVYAPPTTCTLCGPLKVGGVFQWSAEWGYLCMPCWRLNQQDGGQHG